MIGELADVGATTLYVERRGSGPALLFIPGGGTDASHFADVATLLADDFRTVTYDRRGYHRSAAPADWTATSIGEQADDVAALIRALELQKPAVWGGSIGGLVLLDLIHRHPDLVSAAIVHEPPLFALLDDEPRFLKRAGRHGRARPHRWAARSDGRPRHGQARRHLRPPLPRRARAFAGQRRHVPSARRARTRSVTTSRAHQHCADRSPSQSGERPHPTGRAAAELAALLGVPLEFTLGGHGPYATEPQTTAAIIRSTLPSEVCAHDVQPLCLPRRP